MCLAALKNIHFNPPSPAAPLCGADLLPWGTPWSLDISVSRVVTPGPPHKRFARRDENYLVGEPVPEGKHGLAHALG